MILSALLGALSGVSVMAQTNVYSLNAVGYVNVTLAPGYNQLTCPLIASPDNTVGTVLNNGNGTAGPYTGPLTGDTVQFYNPSTGLYSADQAEAVGGRGGTANIDGWANNGTNVLAPGIACWFDNVASSNITITFVGTVPTGSLTNTLVQGYNLVGSILPTSGDVCSNSLMTLTNYNFGDVVLVYNPAALGYSTFQSAKGARGTGGFGYLQSSNAGIDPNAPHGGDWNAPGDPIVSNVGEGFWYQNTGTTSVQWVENYSVSQ